MRLLAGVLVSSLGVVLTGCSSSDGCGSGRDSAVELVEAYVDAASTAEERRDVCPFVAEDNEQAALELATSLAETIEGAGGPAAVELAVDDTRRMGASEVVVASAGGEVVHEFVVVEEDGRFLLLPEMNAP